jgi:hypothetical protein
MNLRALIRSIRNKVNRPEQLSNEMVLGFVRVLERVDKEDITCDELYLKLDEYVERQVDKRDAAYIMPLMREHLEVCPECCEEYEALLHVLESVEDNKTTR